MKKNTAKAVKTAKAERKVDLGKVGEIVKKIPAWLRRAKSELEKLMALIEKAEAALAAWSTLSLLTKEQKAQKKLLEKQVKAMKAYRDALQARVDLGEKE